jgi:hypothetical protein
MNTLKEHFLDMMSQAFPEIKPRTKEWEILQDTFMGGCVVAVERMLRARSADDVRELKGELDAYAIITKAA